MQSLNLSCKLASLYHTVAFTVTEDTAPGIGILDLALDLHRSLFYPIDITDEVVVKD